MNKPKGKPAPPAAGKKKSAGSAGTRVERTQERHAVAALGGYFLVDAEMDAEGQKVTGLYESPIVAWLIDPDHAPEPIALDPETPLSFIRDPANRYLEAKNGKLRTRDEMLQYFVDHYAEPSKD
jgi:hypothetical protein